MNKDSLLAAVILHSFPDASPGDFHSCTCETEGPLLKWLEFNHWTVLLQPRRAEMSQNKPSEEAAEQHYSASGEAIAVGPQVAHTRREQ